MNIYLFFFFSASLQDTRLYKKNLCIFECRTYANITGITIIVQKVEEEGNVAIWERCFYISLGLRQYKSEAHSDKFSYIV